METNIIKTMSKHLCFLCRLQCSPWPSCSCPQGLWLCHQAGLGCTEQLLAQDRLGTALGSALGCSALMPWIV